MSGAGTSGREGGGGATSSGLGSWATCPNAVRAQAEGLVDDLRALVGASLVGVYLHGSLAMGCFNPARGHIDLLVVTHDGMAVETKRQKVTYVSLANRH